MQGKRVYPVAADDNHGEHDMCGGWVRFKADSLTYDNIFGAYTCQKRRHAVRKKLK